MRPLFVLISNALLALLSLFQSACRLVFRAPPVEWVVYELHGGLQRGDPNERPSWIWRLPPGPRIHSIAELQRELDHLKTTPVRGILIKLRDLHCGSAVLRELRAVLESFRASGKEVVIHADHLGNREYWLASAASRILMAPRGRLELIGFAASSSAAARPLRKLGVVFDVIRAGVFKSAGELVGADHVSAEQQRQMDELVGDLNGLYVADVARGRGREPEEVPALIDQGPYSARTALAAGLIDGLGYADEIRALLGKDAPGGPRRARLGPFSAVLVSHAPPAPWRRLRDRRPAVAILDVEGIITGGKSRSAPWMSATAGSESLVTALTRLRHMHEVKAVVLRIDSRGGSAAASDLIWRAAVRLNQEKPVIAYLDDVAASGGYYIAAAGRKIFAAPTCITGSIGVFMMRPNLAGVFEKLEVDRTTVRRGARATIYRTDHALSDDERQALQDQVIETYDEFIQVVTEGRALPEARVRELAEGRVYLATRAREVGLVDELGTLSDAIAAASNAAGLKQTPRLIWWHAAPSGLFEVLRLLRQRDSDDPDARAERLQALWLGEAPL